MASHHLHHQTHHQQWQQQQNNHHPSYQSCCCSCPPSHPPLHHPSPPCQSHHQQHPSPTSLGADPLLVQEITTQILQSSINPLLFSQFVQPQKQPPQPKQQNLEEKQTRSLLTSLLRRIDALESSLRHLSSSSSSSSSLFTPPPPPPPSQSISLKDIAARIIQTHFRAFLVKRSRTLRHLKDLAFIKSTFNTLKSSISNNNNPHLDQSSLSQKALDLLLKLDSIQGGDPMIRDGKRSITRELVQFLEFLDRVSVKRQQISSKSMKNVIYTGKNSPRESRVFVNSSPRDLGSNQRVIFEKLNARSQQIQGSYNRTEDEDDDEYEQGRPRNQTYRKSELYQTRNGDLLKRPNASIRSKKNVSFADNGKVSRVFITTQDSDSDEVFSIGDTEGRVIGSSDKRELVDNLCKEVEELEGFSSRVSEGDSSRVSEEDEEEAEFENRGIPTQFSNSEGQNPREYVRDEVVNHGLGRQFHFQNGNIVFSPPMPVKMDPRVGDDDDTMKR